MENAINMPRWYAIYTKPQEEDRVDRNLAAWGIETFSPRIKKKQLNQFTGKPIYLSRPLFPRYIFARFDAERILHKIYYTRGVKSVISFNHTPLAVENQIIALIQSQVGEDGFVQLEDELRRGDEVWINNGAMSGINGIFDRTMKDKGRVMILLTAINYQASVIVEKELVQKTSRSFYNT
jgi:transcriptional antiterminator RfaH